jgi:3-hydroxyisobutyrate dehydrogenase
MSDAKTGKPQVAWIGLGPVGEPLARRVLAAGYPLAVCAVNADEEPAAAALVEAGARRCATLAEAAGRADVVFTLLGLPEAVEELYLAKGGLVESAKKGARLVDLSASDPQLAHDVAEVAEVSGLHAFDAPVAGGASAARAGTLTAFCGATEADVEPVRPLLDLFAEKVLPLGAPGKGQHAMVAHQIALAVNLVGLSEALTYAHQAGVDERALLDGMGDGLAGSAVLDVLAPKMLEGDTRAGQPVCDMVKDLGLALAGAEEMELTLPATDTANELFGILNEIGGARMGVQALNLVYQDEATCAAHGLDWSVLSKDEDDEDGQGFVGADHGEACSCGHGHAHGHGEACDCGCDDGCDCGCDQGDFSQN